MVEKPAQKIMKPEELLAEIRERAKLARAYLIFLDTAGIGTLRDATEEAVNPQGEKIIPFDRLDEDPTVREAYAKALFRRHLTHAEAALGIKYAPLKDDASVRKHVGYTLFRKTEDTLRQAVEVERSNYPKVHKAYMQKHRKNLESELPELTTAHISEEELPKLSQYLGIDLKEISPAQWRQVIYLKATQTQKDESSRLEAKTLREFKSLQTSAAGNGGDYSVPEDEGYDAAVDDEYDQAA